MRKFFLILSAIFFLLISAIAQNRTITGQVTDEKGQGIPKASVIVRGTRIGTTTNNDGNFSLSVPSNAKALVISSVGMTPQEVLISGPTVNVALTMSTATSLEGVVVTSLGITRDKRSLGYAADALKGAELANRGEVNLVNALQGKVAGVNITNASGGAGASTNINIRGVSSFTGSNQPLFVVDGIPISNDVDRTNGGPTGTLGDNQPANRAVDIDMNNVESVNILKGPAAAALYGSRASSGAIIITTKKGGNARGRAEVILNSSFSFQNAFGLPKVQNIYGQGANGVYNGTSGNSLGPKFGSTPTIENGLLVNGVPVSYQAYPNNINEFFQQGTIADNSLTINGGDAVRNQTFSLGNVTQYGIVPNTFLKRSNVRFGANSSIGEKLKLGGSITYTNTVQQGILGGNGNSALSNVLGLARNIDLTSYRVNRTYKNPNGTNNFVLPSTDNPYFDAYENPLTSNLNRFTGNVNVAYDIIKGINISYRLGGDIYYDRRKQIFAISSGRVPLGQVLEESFFRSEINGDLLIRGEKKNFFFHDLSLTGLIGQNINQRRFQNTAVQADALAVPGFYNVSGGTGFSSSRERSELRRLIGYYAQASFNYKNYAFIEFTGRADQSSTLPKSKSTYFYPSVNASLVFTDAFDFKSDIFSYGKIRANYAKVGKDADPYLLDNVFISQSFGNNVANFTFPLGNTAGFGASSRLSPIEPLSPEFKTSYEVGVNLQFFKNRASLDVTYYDEDSKSQIINVALAPSTGFGTFTTNIGELTNKGLEVTATATVLRTRNFTWDISANYTKQRSMVVSIAPGVDNTFIPGSRFGGSIASFKVGYPYGVIIGGLIPRSPDGDRIVNPATGTYQPTVAGGILADPNSDYQFGVTNNISYKGFSLGFTFDFTKGGQILSFTSAAYKARGVLDITAVDREQPHIVPGVILDASGKYVPNNIQISGQTYWNTVMGGLQSEFNVFDATVLHLRELTLGYNVPANIIKTMHLAGLRFGIFARNVFYVAPNSPIDPQLNTQGAGNIRGLDLQGVPNARTIGANLRITL